LLLMRAWHEKQGRQRTKIVIPDSAHGTNPASVTLGGYETVTVPSDGRGCVDVAALRKRLDDDVAGIMLTNPNTLGLFEEDIVEIAGAVHEVGGLLYYGGAGLRRIAEVAVLNANWIRHRLRGVYDVPYDRPNMHECVLSAASLKKRNGLRAVDVAKRLLEEGFHAPTIYFPLIVDEALM